ncbi:MAG: dephospho-CoA kinase, partial [Pisciglobus halotolerans]|nr:dephospho-CoA kinase [Pisciglobus halotolerans]
MEACILGLTGSIGTGKSTVSTIFKQQGIAVVDADIGAREVVKLGTIGLKKIVTAFGKDILLSDGTLDRKALGEIVFSNPSKRQKLDQLLAGLIYNWIIKEKQKYIAEGQKIIVLDIPLLFEGGYEKEVDKIIVVALTEQKQLER